jgi:hypothetical protein
MNHDRTAHRRSAAGVALTALFLSMLLGCAEVPAPAREPETAPPPPPVTSASVAVSAGENPIDALKALLADRRAKPALVGAGALLGAIVLAVGVGKILRGDAPKAGPGNVAGG